jgi:SAM-dependent methyltransferase
MRENDLQTEQKTPLGDRFKNLAPPAARRLSRHVKAVLHDWQNRGLSAQDVFTKVYAEKMWGDGPESFYSGPGSNEEAAAPYADFVTGFIAEHHIRSVVDLGCGDFRVGHMLASSGVSFTGVDVVQPLVDENSRRFATETIRFLCLDIAKDALPDADLCLIREVFQHISNAQISAVLAKLHKYNYVLFTDVQPENTGGYGINRDKIHGASSRLVHKSCLKLEEPPFNVKTVRLVFEATPPYFTSYTPFGSSFKLRTFLLESNTAG